MRVFLAIPMDEPIKKALQESVDLLRASRASVRWVGTDGLHATVKFLGRTEESTVSALAGQLGAVCSSTHPMPMTVSGLGAYPSPKRPRVLWAGVQEPTHSLGRLQEAVEEITSRMGWERERRPFSPHVTLGRVKGNINIPQLVALLDRYRETPWGMQTAMELIMYTSTLTPQGAIYSPLHRFPFRETGCPPETL